MDQPTTTPPPDAPAPPRKKRNHPGRLPILKACRRKPTEADPSRWKSPISDFLADIRACNAIEHAAVACGLSVAAVLGWLQRARGDMKGPDGAPLPPHSWHLEFMEDYERAKAESIERLVNIVAAAAEDNPSFALAMLRQRDPERWGLQHQVVKAEVTTKAAAPEPVEPTPEQKALETRLGKDLAAEVADIDAWVAELKPRRADPGVAGTILRLKERRDRLLGLNAPGAHPGAPGGGGGAAAGVAMGLGEFLARAFPENQPGYDPAAQPPADPGGLDGLAPVER